MFDIIIGLAFTAVGGYLVGSTKDDDPNRKTLKGFGIFFIIVGIFAFAYGVVRMMLLRQGMAAPEYTPNPVFEQPQQVENAVVAEQPPANVNAPNGTVIVNNPAPGNTSVGVRNNNKNKI